MRRVKLLEKWCCIRENLCEGLQLTVPCCLTDIKNVVTLYNLCGFCDTSLCAFAAVVYLLIDTPSGYQVKYLTLKIRVAPIKPLTIPRLELLSSLILAWSISLAIESELSLGQHFCFTESMVALHWVHGTDKRWKPFVHNRAKRSGPHFTVTLVTLLWTHQPG